MRFEVIGRASSATAALAALCLTTAAVSAQEDVKWTTSTSGGSTIDIPVFMTEGLVRALMIHGSDYGTAFDPELYPVQIRQYRTRYVGRPYVYLSESLGPQDYEITYSVDREGLGVMSGYSADRKEVFYAMCRKDETVYCFDMHYAKKAQAMFGPIVERIAKSFQR